MSGSKRGETALITGASSGIGLEIARLLAAKGYDLVLGGRDSKRLAEVSRTAKETGVSALVVEADLSSAEGVEKLVQSLGRKKVVVDVLVNNAGFGNHGAFADTDPATQQAMIDLNISTVARLTHHYLRGMIERRRGKILNVASTAAFVPGPLMSVYYASKSFVLSFSLALSAEVEGTGVTVTALCPGATRTNFDVAAGTTETKLNRGNVMSADVVARQGVAGMEAGRRLVVPGFSNKLLALSARFAPRRMTLRIVRSLNTKST